MMHRRLSRIALFASIVVSALVGSPMVRVAAAVETGVWLTPANFPRHGAADVSEMYRIAGELGDIAVMNFSWNDAQHVTVAEQMSRVADQFQLKSMLRLDILKPGGTTLAPPGGLDSSRMDGATYEAYVSEARRLARLKPAYLAIGTDVNRLLAQGTAQLAEFAAAYKNVYDVVKAESPKTKVFVTFSWDIFMDASAKHGVGLAELRQFVDLFRPKLDVLAFSSVPNGKFRSPADIPQSYYEGIAAFAGSEPIALDLGWPSGSGGEAAQAAFVEKLPAYASVVRAKLVLWPNMHDLDAVAPLASLGLYKSNGQPKAAAAKFRQIGKRETVAASAAAPAAQGSAGSTRRSAADRFAIYTAPLSGGAPTLLVSDPSREINHAHLSPDRSKLVFTRYNIRNGEGVALEVTGYLQTEIVLCAADGDDCKVIIPPRRGIIAANASWTPDGRGLLFVTNDTPSRVPGVSLYTLATGLITPFYHRKDLAIADPHMIRDLMVAPGSPPNASVRVSQLYLVSRSDAEAAASGKQPRIATQPQLDNVRKMEPPMGDHDPKLSPDAKRIAVMRHYDQDAWGIVVVDVASGTETRVSPPDAVDAVPEWSSDGKLLIFWHVDPAAPKKSGIFTMKPDGSERRRVPLPAGYFYTMPAFVPGEGSTGASRIIFSAQPNPAM